MILNLILIGTMTKADQEIDGHVYNDVYKVTLPEGYMKIRFAANLGI